MNIHVRGVQKLTWLGFRASAVKLGLSTGELLERLLEEWLSKPAVQRKPGTNQVTDPRGPPHREDIRGGELGGP